MSEKRTLSVSVPLELWESFCAKADIERHSPSSVMKRLIRDYVKDDPDRLLASSELTLGQWLARINDEG